ncbi:MAG: ABC transporter permease [Bacteroidia bacterium]
MFIILIKELKAFLKDHRAVILGFLMPIILITVFSLAFGAMFKTNDKKMRLLVSDEDKSAVTKKAIAGIDSIKFLDISGTTTDSALLLIKRGKYSAALIFHKGFSDSVKALKPLPWEMKYDASQSIEMQMIQQYLLQSLYGSVGKMMSENMVMRNTAKQVAGMDSMSILLAMMQAKKNFESNSADMDKLTQNIMKIESSPIEKEQNDFATVQAVAGTAVMMLLFSLTAMGGRLLEEKENGTLKRLLYSPLKASDILGGKMLSTMIFAICQLLIMFFYSSLVFGLILLPHIVPVLLQVTATAFACSSFGVFLGSIKKAGNNSRARARLSY